MGMVTGIVSARGRLGDHRLITELFGKKLTLDLLFDGTFLHPDLLLPVLLQKPLETSLFFLEETLTEVLFLKPGPHIPLGLVENGPLSPEKIEPVLFLKPLRIT